MENLTYESKTGGAVNYRMENCSACNFPVVCLENLTFCSNCHILFNGKMLPIAKFKLQKIETYV